MSDQPFGDDPASNEPRHPDEQAELRERSEGASEDNVTGTDNFRADDTAPGVDPDEADA
ncbi:hypothetical protein [Egicoccus halophilus]|uniref:Uncharacterized protein n=1 Tax=Egicoccus halophilus TaxID=1670830 RepID=A0A8J3AFM3_9ACTN|nr:hypothetical protein [Egicoccus halophilus]GGI08104.1 hypothetical protein GCM10011354_27430 [Egicoccus halophilus]